MKLDYENKIPKRFWEASYEKDVPQEIKETLQTQFKKRDGIFLWGDSGVGKTHIACAISKDVLDRGMDIMFFNTSDFLEKLREEFNKDTYDSLFRDVMDFKGVLFLDDIGAEKSSEWTQERIYLILNKRYEEMLPVIFTSNCDMETLSMRVGDRVASRIAGMTTRVHLEGDDKRLTKKDV